MSFSTPPFWYKKPGILSCLLQPLGWIYGCIGSYVRAREKVSSVPIPVISIGNIVSGGSGKTPVAIALAKALQKEGKTVHFVTRGYGGSEKGPLQVDSTQHTYKDVGDESLLLAHIAPTWIARTRYEGALKAYEAGADVIILDDGHQHASLQKDCSILVVDALQKFGNKAVIPAGPLRESLKEGLARSDAMLILGAAELDVFYTKPIFHGSIIPQKQSWDGQSLYAFAGLGYPQKFFNTLKKCGYSMAAQKVFPDHHPYNHEDMDRLLHEAQTLNAMLVTTEKDLLRIPPIYHDKIHVLPIKAQLPKSFISFVLGECL